ncbi:hypothetical protein BDN72DRAFT_785226 [Pluteus cervinus]|uniref:Uncharacterized protein n=1 Tax=Pluteus cervinus TaxID=181527 RepID=A0ACD3BEM1_9AGAR|nr:hypothetical protein BDN72DRAFT_785226 [Pluteus cervinus]
MSSSWFSSWLPPLPSLNFPFPSRLQGRFVSFILKKSLGHFLKPGQLDAHQIDAQIGSGYVQISDLELDDQAINALLSDLPIRLYDGSIASVTARIPLPNPLVASVGLALNALHLTFKVVPTSSRDGDELSQSISSLAESVVSVAESFVHDELGSPEDAELLQSLHYGVPPAPSNDFVPGGLDPFLATSDEPLSHADADPAGVSIFATLIERLLAKFEFDAVDTRITLIHPDNTSVTLSLNEVRYRTESKSQELSSSNGETRNLTLSGLRVSLCDLRAPPDPFSNGVQSPPGTPTISPKFAEQLTANPSSRPPSPSSSSSSLDDETQLAMSQSLAFLPPRPRSPSNSVASSMYQSALSVAQSMPQIPEQEEPTAKEDDNIPPLLEQSHRPSAPVMDSKDTEINGGAAEELFLSFGTTPIVIQLTTPSPGEQSSVEPRSTGVRDIERVQVNVSLGVIACTVRPWHIRALVQLADASTPPSKSRTKSKGKKTDKSAPGLKMGLSLKCSIRGLVVLLLPRMNLAESWLKQDANPLDGFFARPLTPPKISQGYFRLHLDGLILEALIPPADDSPRPSAKRSAPSSLTTFSVILHDLSFFLFRAVQDDETWAIPILITDPHLPAQYSSHHVPISFPIQPNYYPQLPVFDVLDWTHEQHRSLGTKLSAWRTRPKIKNSKNGPESPSDSTPQPNAVSVKVVQKAASSKSSDTGSSMNIDVKIAPIQLLVDLGSLLEDNVLRACAEEANLAGPSRADVGVGKASDTDFTDEEDLTPPTTPRAQMTRETEMERKRLERLVMKDLDLDVDYLSPKPGERRKSKLQKQQSAPSLSVVFSMVRIQVRTPSPARFSTRSGSFVLDLHEIKVLNGLPPTRPTARFAPNPQPPSGGVQLSVQLKRAVAAYALVGEKSASAFFSIGSLEDISEGLPDQFEGSPEPLQPHFKLHNSNSAKGEPLIVTLDLPSVHGHLSKPTVHGLQYWVDDLTQLMEAVNRTDKESIQTETADGSLIGSRFFTNSRTGSGSTISGSPKPKPNEIVMKTTVSEAFLRVVVPILESSSKDVHLFDVAVVDLDMLLEIAPETKDETVITLGIMDIAVQFANKQGVVPLLSLTAPRHVFLAQPPNGPHSESSSAQPLVKLRFTSAAIPGTTAKESRIRLSLWGFTCNVPAHLGWVKDLEEFAKNPPGTFESVIPTERSSISVRIINGSVRAFAPNYPGAIILYLGDLSFKTDVVGNAPDSTFSLSVPSLAIFAIDDVAHGPRDVDGRYGSPGMSFWRRLGYALLVELHNLDLRFASTQSPKRIEIIINKIGLRVHLCADSISAVAAFVNDLVAAHQPPPAERPPVRKPGPIMVSEPTGDVLTSSMLKEHKTSFEQVPEVGPTPDFLEDDLPTNLEYLDFGAAAGVRELEDEFDEDDAPAGLLAPQLVENTSSASQTTGETIKMFQKSIKVEEHYFERLIPEAIDGSSQRKDAALSVTVHNGDIALLLYDGYDWVKTRKAIEEEVKEMRRRLAKIRQLVASGQTQDPDLEEASAVLFNSVYIGLSQDLNILEPNALIAAIDEELKDDIETASQSSWQSLRQPSSSRPQPKSFRVHGRRLSRSKGPSIEICLSGLGAEFDQYQPDAPVVSRTSIIVHNLEILDHIPTSTWNKFLTPLRSDSHGNIRETGSNMVRIELLSVHPVPGHPSEEARLRVKILPIRLFVDQDAVDFLKKFFSFKDSSAQTAESTSDDGGIYFQLAEVFPVDLKLDYKPRRVDYRALKEGRTIELMNFFHFDAAEMTLRHITLAGITGWPRFFDLLNDLWTPDVKATQLVDVISGVAPIRSVVNVGSGVADLVLLPIAQYKKDGRIVRGVQKGTTAFIKSTAIEAVKLGARLATGTQVILEQAENVLGGQFNQVVTTETVQISAFDDDGDQITYSEPEGDDPPDRRSKYADQPIDVTEGVQVAVKGLRKNLNSAAQTILAVPMEVYERSGSEGAVRSVIRAVPIAVLKPMIGASEALSKTLLGLHNTLDPNLRHDNEAKYKHS